LILHKRIIIMKEHDYQHTLESVVHGNHRRNLYGITDITTDDAHIEIKKWSDYKTALGQLIAYNHGERKKDLYVYFFGPYAQDKKEKVVELFKAQGINVVELCVYRQTWFNTKHENVSHFVRENLIVDQLSKITCKAVWDRYVEWCDKRHVKPVKQKDLEKKIEEMLIIPPKSKNNKYNTYMWSTLKFVY